MSVNASEARLSALTRSTFLSMWSYQNPYYAPGKELCDVLVVFGRHVILMSDKLIEFGTHEDPRVNWSRWHKKAVAGSIRQLAGAKRQLKRAPNQVFVDESASAVLPLALPPLAETTFHMVAVANGSATACLRVMGVPSFELDTRASDDSKPFCVGTRTSKGDFVHVLSEAAVDAIFGSLDTARDFIDYLTRKELALTDGEWLVKGEENLIASYLTSQPGDAAFAIPVESFSIECGARTVPRGLWENYQLSSWPEQRIEWSRRSRVVDRLIEHVFTEHQQHAMIRGQDSPLAAHAEAWSLLASESRVSRQLLAASLMEIINEEAPTFWCTVTASMDTPGLVYVFLTYPEPPADVPDDELEVLLTNELSKYMVVAQKNFRKADRLFGICVPGKNCTRLSRLFQLRDGSLWSEEMRLWAEYFESEEGVLAAIDEVQLTASR